MIDVQFVSAQRHTGELSILAGCRLAPAPEFVIHPADGTQVTAYRRLRRDAFVAEQGLFQSSDRDDIDDDPRTVVMVAVAADGTVVGGVRLAPVGAVDIGWWTGSRLVTDPTARAAGVGTALVRAACAYAEANGLLRFEATVQKRHQPLFAAIGWRHWGDCTVAGRPHARMRWPLTQIQRQAATTKSFLGAALEPLRAAGGLGPHGFVGDDGAPVPGSDLVAACDAIVPSMVERDPEWAGWCSVLVNINDISAMGATPSGLLDAVGAPTRSLLTRIIRGVAKASAAWRVPVLGGHTQLGVPAALSVTALGRTAHPIPAGGGRVGDTVRLTADLSGGWRPGYHGRQWDSTTTRSSDELCRMVNAVAAMRPHAAKDVSMAGVVGTIGMLAEASGTGAELDVAALPRPEGADMGSWLTCFPGFAMLTAGGTDQRPAPPPGIDGVASADCGTLTAAPGVRLRWPDGIVTTAVAAEVTGLGPA